METERDAGAAKRKYDADKVRRMSNRSRRVGLNDGAGAGRTPDLVGVVGDPGVPGVELKYWVKMFGRIPCGDLGGVDGPRNAGSDIVGRGMRRGREGFRSVLDISLASLCSLLYESNQTNRP